MSNSPFAASLLLGACVTLGWASELVSDQRPPSDFISMELDKTSALKGEEAILKVRYPADCEFSGLRSPDFDAREESSELTEYQPHRHFQQSKSFVPITSPYSGKLTDSHPALNQSPTYAGPTHKHHLRETRFALTFATSGEVSVGPLEVICEGKVFRTARRKVRVSPRDEDLFKTVDLRVLSGPGGPQAPSPILEPEPQAAPPPQPILLPEAPNPTRTPGAIEAQVAHAERSLAPIADRAGMEVPGLLAVAAGVLSGLGVVTWLIVSMAKKLPANAAGTNSSVFSSRLGRFSPLPPGKSLPPQKAGQPPPPAPRPVPPRPAAPPSARPQPASPPPAAPQPSPVSQDIFPARADSLIKPQASAGLPAFLPLPQAAPPPPAPAPPHGPFPTPTGAGKRDPARAGLSDSTPTSVAGRYEILSQLGAGGMGTVLLGHDTKLSRKVAIKQMRSEIRTSPKECARFLAEARIIAKLRHPFIVGIHDIIEEAGQIFLILDFVEGKSLSSILDEKRRLSLPECKHLFSQVCEAVDFAHSNKVLHRDLKPANILVNKEGFALVADFGIAREAKDTICRATQTEVTGSPAYMAPEQHLGEAGKSSDIFSLGVMLYEMLVGERPFTGLDFLAQKERKMYRPPSDALKELNFRCDRLFESVLAPAPDQRPASAMALYQRLKEL